MDNDILSPKTTPRKHPLFTRWIDQAVIKAIQARTNPRVGPRQLLRVALARTPADFDLRPFIVKKMADAKLVNFDLTIHLSKRLKAAKETINSENDSEILRAWLEFLRQEVEKPELSDLRSTISAMPANGEEKEEE